MAPVNMELVIELYETVKTTISKGVPAVVKAVVELGVLHVGLAGQGLGDLVSMVVSWALDKFKASEKGAIYIALRLEHCNRHGNHSSDVWHVVRGRWNVCSKCELVGHNKSNCPASLKKRLEQLDVLDDAQELAGDIHDLVMDG